MDACISKLSAPSADPGRAELDAAEEPGHDDHTFEVVPSKQLEQLQPGAPDLAVVARLLDDALVGIAHPARPAVVARLVVFFRTLPDHLLRLAKS